VVSEVGQSALDSKLKIVAGNGQEMAAIDIKSEGSSASYAALAQGSAAIGMSSRRARDRDIAVLRQAGVPDLRDTDNEHVIALDGLIAITHPSNPVKAISVEELAQVFSGRITNWADLGGPRGPINVYAPSDQTGTFQTFGSLVLAPSGALITQGARRFDRHSELSDSVANDPAGIGVTGIAFRRAAKALPIRQSCGILSYPTTFAMKTEEYPLSRRLYLYTRPDGTPAHAKQLVEFALSDLAQPLIAEAGLVNQSVESQSLDAQGARLVYAMTTEDEFSPNLMRQMLLELRDADRLSITFRFTPGASTLTPKSQIDIGKLAQDISSGFYAGREVMLVGFTDSVGQFALNQGLAARRAGVVETELLGLIAPGALNETSISSIGYGELTPVGCNNTLQGRTANRRVEVWIRSR
jgi:phosphate transport system substrate-binding protein